MAFDSNNLKDGSSTPFNVDKQTAIDAIISGQTSGNFKTGSSDVMYTTSLENAVSAVRQAIPGELLGMGQLSAFLYPYIRTNQEEAAAAQKKQDVVTAVCYGYQSDCLVCVAVYFTDFQAVALLPDNSGSNYVTTLLRNNKKTERTYASNVKNLTLSPVTASQNVSTSWTSSVTSTVNHSSSYSFAESFKVGAKFSFEVAEVTGEVGFTATQAFSNGWSKATTESKSGTISETVSVSLPPYTNVLLEQGSSSTEAETKYNCPIGLKYKAIVKPIIIWSIHDGILNMNGNGKVVLGPDARADLYRRAIQDGDLNVDNEVYWTNMLALPGMRDRVSKITSHVPMSSVGATFLETRDTSFTEVKSIAPTESLAIVKILPPDVNFVGGQQLTYNNLNYLHADMKVGDSSYTNYLKLRGKNAFGAEYYGFTYRNGSWIVVKPDGTQWNDGSAPVKVERDAATGYMRYTAVKPGTCFLKYVINENCYATADDIQTYVKNSDLESTAALEITVSGVKEEIKPTGTITVSGNYFGFVNKDPERLDGDDGLTVSIQDMSGKELDKPYHWEKQELDSRGILLNAENKVSFTKTGTYHVRAVCDEIAAKSEWYEIEVHDYTFTAEGTNIMASCTDPQCEDVVIAIHAPQKTVYGDGKSAWASVTGEIPGLTPPSVTYKRGTETLNAPPRDAGIYTAGITIGDATAEVTYKIEQADSSVIEPPDASGIILGQSLANSLLMGGTGSTAGSFSWKDSTIRPELSDSKKTPYEVTFTPNSANYKPSTCTAVLYVGPDLVEIKTPPKARTLTYDGSVQELVEPGVAEKGRIVYALTQDAKADARKLTYTDEIPAAIEAGIYYVWYETIDLASAFDSGPFCVPVTIGKVVPEIDFPVTQLLATGMDQPLIVDPVVTPSEGVTVYYSLDDTENELLDSPVAKELGEYAVYYRIESNTPSCESVPYGEPVIIQIQDALAGRLPDLAVILDSWTYGEEAQVPVVIGNEDFPVSFLYKERDDFDENYTETVPTDAGDYTVQAVVTSPDYYGTVTATANFHIEKRTPVLDEDYSILPNTVIYDGTYQPMVTIAVKDGTTLKLWCSFDRKNTLAGTPKKRDVGKYEIWYKVSGDKNYEELNDWNGPILAAVREEVIVTVPSAAKFYDGEPMPLSYELDGLTDEYSVSDVVYSDTITEVGEKLISVTGLKITNTYGENVTGEYGIRLVPGRKVVLDVPDFIVPAVLEEIQEESFAGIAAESVMLGKTVADVGPYAFRDCKALKTLIVCGTDTEFDNTALSGCENVTVYAPLSSKARQFAVDNELDFVPPDGDRLNNPKPAPVSRKGRRSRTFFIFYRWMRSGIPVDIGSPGDYNDTNETVIRVYSN